MSCQLLHLLEVESRLDHGFGELELGPENRVDGLVGDSCLEGNLLHRHAGVGAASQQAASCVEDALTGHLSLFLPERGVVVPFGLDSPCHKE